MFWKDELTVLILNQEFITYDWLISLQNQFPSLRVKTIDVNGTVPVIQLSGKSEWQKPIEWANNHLASLKQQYGELHSRLVSCNSDPSVLCTNSCAALKSLETQRSNDLMKLEELQRLVAQYDSTCNRLIRECYNVIQGKRLSEEVIDYVIRNHDEKTRAR